MQTGSPRAMFDVPGITITEIAYHPDERQPTHYHRRSSLTLVLSGGLEERVGRACEVARPLSVVIKPAGTEHSDRVGPTGAATVQISVQPDIFSDAASPTWRWLHGARAARRFLACVSTTRTELGDPGVVEGAVVELIAALAADDRGRSGPPPRWLQIVAQQVDDCFASRPRVDALARAVGVHPVYLARCFRFHYGTSITERVRERRVERAAALLGAQAPLSSVAYRSGFVDQSHLSRVFRSATGLTPGRYRALARG